jgi:hypothetical protein
MTIKLFDLAGRRGQGASVAELQRCAEKQFQSLVGISQICNLARYCQCDGRIRIEFEGMMNQFSCARAATNVVVF